MALPISDNLRNAINNISIAPQLVFEIDGVPTVYGISSIKRIIEIGDTFFFIGNDYVIGESIAIENQLSGITLEGTTTSINQSLEIDKARSSSISTFQVALIDFFEDISSLISPGMVVADILGRKCKVYLGVAENTSFPDDYIIIFRGIIDEVVPGAGKISFNLTHPDKKKQQTIFIKSEAVLNGAINSSTTTITLDQSTDFLVPVNGPSGSPDSSLTHYVQIDNEIIKYTGISTNVLTGVVRAQLNTIAAAHDDQAEVSSFYRLEGNSMDLALKIMLSGKNDFYKTAVDITHFGTDGITSTANSIFFQNVDLESLYNVTEGDYVTTTGASNGANNFSLKTIDSVTVTSAGTTLVINSVSIIEEPDTAGTISFRSQYDTLGTGLSMDPDEVDILEHTQTRDRYLIDFDYDFYLKDTIENAKEFIEKEIYLPASCFSLPRKSQSSLGIFTPPIPGSDISTINKNNITNAEAIKLKRSINKDFYNTIIYKYDESALEEKFRRGVVTVNTDSKTRIPIGTKSLIVESHGMRQILNGQNLATQAINRRLNIYKFAAESADSIKIQFSDGFSIEVGDIIIGDFTDLSVTNLDTGSRDKAADLYFVKNRTINFKTGEVSIDIVNSGFSTDQRYGLISPSSYIDTGSTSTVLKIKSSFSSKFGANEGLKWKRFIGEIVRVRNLDFTNNSTAQILNVVGNTVTLGSALSFTPSVDDIMEFSHYNDMTSRVYLVYVFMTDQATFDDGLNFYSML